MTELELYKFVNERHCEWHWGYHIDGIHLILIISHCDLRGFCKMLDYSSFDDGGLNCDQRLLYDGSVGLVPFENICEYYGIDAEKVFPKEEER